jgi:hypothetical protein
MPAANLGMDYDLAKRLAALERAVKMLGGNQLGQAFSATQSDGSVGLSITQAAGSGATAFRVYQGPNTPRDPNTGLHATLLYIGQLQDSGGGSLHAGLLCARENGKYYFTASPLGGFAVYDSNNNVVVAPDEGSGQGLALPWLPYPTPVSMGTAQWPNTTSTSWASIAQSAVFLQQPKMRWFATVYVPAGTADVQLLLTGGVALSPVHSVGAGFTNIDEVLTVPAGHSFLEANYLVVNARVTSGAGPVYVQVFGIQGRQT